MNLRGMTWDHPRGFACLEAASKTYKASYGVSLTWDRRSLQEFADASIEYLAENYDLIVLDHPHVGLIAETGCLHPLPMPNNPATMSLGGSLESYIWQGQLWSMPIDAACQMAVMRDDLGGATFNTWDEVLSGQTDLTGTVTALLPVDAFCLMMTLVATAGETKLPFSDRQFTSDKIGLQALHVLKALYKAGPSEAVNWNPIRVLEAMSTSDDFRYSPALFGYVNYARPGFRDHMLSFGDLPCFVGRGTMRGILGGAGMGVSSRGKHIEKALAFVTWVSSETVQSGVYLQNGGQPAHKATWNRMGSVPEYVNFLTGARATMEAAWTRPRDIWYLGFVDEICEILPKFFRKDRDEETFLAEINALYVKYLGQAAS